MSGHGRARPAVAHSFQQSTFEPYSHPKSPHKFTQPQLFALLVLRQYFRLDYRGVIEWVREWPKLQRALGITRLPH